MPATTPEGIPYVLPSDHPLEYPAASQQLATAIETVTLLKTGGTLTGDVTIDKAAAAVLNVVSSSDYGEVRVSAPDAKTSGIVFQKAALNRWKLSAAATTNDLVFNRYDAAGAYVDGPFKINAADGLVTAGPKVNITPYSGFSDFGSTFAGMWATRSGGMVTIEGLVKRSSADLALTAGGSFSVGTIANAACYPAHDVMLAGVIQLNGSTTMAPCRIQVSTAGLVTAAAFAAGTLTAANGWIAIGGTYRGAGA